MVERQIKLVMFEGPQGSGKTTASLFLSENGYKNSRGIPLGEQLVLNCESENWRQSLKFLQETVESDDNFTMDRSIWSLVVFNMRKKPDNGQLIYNLGKSLFQRRIGNTNYRIAILVSRAEECLGREEKNSIVAIRDIEEAQEEVDAYDTLAHCLEKDGLKVARINNSGISKEEFLASLEQLFEK